MSEPSSKIAKGGGLVAIAAIITAVVPLFVGTAGDRADKADDKAELGMALIKQQLEFLGKEVDELKQDNRELRRYLRRLHGNDGWHEEMPPAAADGDVDGDSDEGEGAEMPVPPEIEGFLPEPTMQKRAPQLPSAGQLDALLSK